MKRKSRLAPIVTSTKTGTMVTFEYVLFDKYGNKKMLWQENRLGRFIRERLATDIQHKPFGKWVPIMRNVVKQKR